MKDPKIIFQVDAFTSKPFRGNPAGVCILDKKPSVKWMQNVAMEMNLSETAFVFPGNGHHTIRFYTPESEIKLCGHATLSTGHIMFETGMHGKGDEISLRSKAGILRVRYEKQWLIMNFPAYSCSPADNRAGFERMTGIKPSELWRTANGWILALVDREDLVREMKPDLKAMKGTEFGHLIVTGPSSDKRFDFCVRCFAPSFGIDEDPVTGSAHCALTPFWYGKTGKEKLVSHQVSKRGGILKVEMKGNRVEIAGQAITIIKGELMV
jgi:PhzF family phenazine biosynthesis protein